VSKTCFLPVFNANRVKGMCVVCECAIACLSSVRVACKMALRPIPPYTVSEDSQNAFTPFVKYTKETLETFHTATQHSVSHKKIESAAQSQLANGSVEKSDALLKEATVHATKAYAGAAKAVVAAAHFRSVHLDALSRAAVELAAIVAVTGQQAT
jgi:hypothetical protein